MNARTPRDNGGVLKRHLVRRILARLASTCDARRYTSVRYADLAHLVGLPWIWTRNNANTIVTLRAALAALDRERLISVRPATHDAVLVRLTETGVMNHEAVCAA